MKIFDKSSLWDSILDSDCFKKINIDQFKDEGINFRIAQYNYKTHGLLFLKNILFNMAESFGKEFLLLDRIPNRDVGKGVSINYAGITVDLDYLLAIGEIIFLKKKLKKITSILEIGAGYGRTCHSILSLFPNIKFYHIVDLPEMIALSSAYLKKVSNEENFSKVQFVSTNDLFDQEYDLIININSMQEMNPETVEAYLLFIDENAHAFYTKNTVGKFTPAELGFERTKASELAMSSGILRDIVNIFCPKDLKKAQKNFLHKFSPGKTWLVEKEATTEPWSHYYQALYVKNISFK